jgi:gas vesicle protein
MIEHKNSSNFWFGLMIGASLGAGSLYLLGTKNGRKQAKKILDAAEDWEMVLEDVLAEVDEKTIGERENVKEGLKEFGKTASGNMETVLEKIFSVAHKHESKKYFSKDGKILK